MGVLIYLLVVVPAAVVGLIGYWAARFSTAAEVRQARAEVDAAQAGVRDAEEALRDLRGERDAAVRLTHALITDVSTLAGQFDGGVLAVVAGRAVRDLADKYAAEVPS